MKLMASVAPKVEPWHLPRPQHGFALLSQAKAQAAKPTSTAGKKRCHGKAKRLLFTNQLHGAAGKQVRE